MKLAQPRFIEPLMSLADCSRMCASEITATH